MVFLTLIMKLAYVQITCGSTYKTKIQGRSQLTVRLPAVRGDICDRNGVPLVENRASLEVDFYLPDIVKAFREKEGYIPTVTYRGLEHGMPVRKEEADIVKIVNSSIIHI